MQHFEVKENTLTYRRNHETILLRPWGPDGIRVQSTMGEAILELPNALVDELPGAQGIIATDEDLATLTNGRLRAEISIQGRLRFLNIETREPLLEEPERLFWSYPARNFEAREGDLFHLEMTFAAQPGEQFYGLGQHTHGILNQKGCAIRLQQTNTEVSIPFLLSSQGYGFLWNNPGLGRVELAENATRWVAEGTRQMDYVVFAGGTPGEILTRYVTATGRPPLLPEWALGFWQCKLRYRTQEELLEVAREYKRRGLPIQVIVVDYFHWTMMGDWKFDPAYWPNPAEMMRELKEMGVELMVSIWPTVNINSENYAYMRDAGYLVRADRNLNSFMSIHDRFPEGPSLVTYYDTTNPDARAFVWNKVRENYYNYGIRVFWLDADEPEIYPITPGNLRYHLGSAVEVGNIYPLLHQKGFYEGEQAAGEQEIVNLSRSAWAGTQRYGAAVWSGDIPSTFEYLQKSVRAGLNIAMSGIPWWTTDIGGFLSGDIRTDYFKELVVRWFQYGVFCPIFRLHGARLPDNGLTGADASGASNEVWSFGETAYGIIRKLMEVRERLRPYLMEQNRVASEIGLPPMRPLFIDFPNDPVAWEIDDQFMLGPDLLIAPVTGQGQTERKVYLPAGADWLDAWTGKAEIGGVTLTVSAPLERVPVYWRADSPSTFIFGE